MKKPPRKSKEQEAAGAAPARQEISCQTEQSTVSRGQETLPRGKDHQIKSQGASATLPMNFAENIPTTLPSLTSKAFKMLRLRKNLVSSVLLAYHWLLRAVSSRSMLLLSLIPPSS